MVKHIDTNTFENIIKDKNGNYVVDFWAKWCGPCKMIAPIFEELSDEITDVEFCKVDVDENSELAMKLRVASIPTIIFVHDGDICAKSVGYMEKEELRLFIEENR